jgi:nitrate reductase delta subunit
MGLFRSSAPKMVLTLRALAWLLRYPDPQLRASLPALRDALYAEGALCASRLREIDTLVDRLLSLPELAAEAEYVDLFDRGRQTALNLFEHIHGDSRDRGQAMIDLVQTYARAGLLFGEGELPDYLPVVLEFASTQPAQHAREFLLETTHIVRAIFSALLKRNSRYASVLAAVIDLAGERAEPMVLAEEPPLDECWAEPEAFGGCSSAGQSKPGQPQPIHVIRHAATLPTPHRAA